MNDESIRDLLRVLTEADASAEAPPEVEVRLRKKFRSRRRKLARRRVALWTPLVPAAAVIVLLFVFVHRRPATARVKPGSISTAAASSLEQTSPSQAASPRTTTHPGKSAASPPQEPEEIDTHFFLLMDPAPPFERGKILRVELPASAMEMVGLPVDEEHLADSVQADVLIGEEGLPRAIRFVKFEMK
jgi:hypothetical protein